MKEGEIGKIDGIKKCLEDCAEGSEGNYYIDCPSDSFPTNVLYLLRFRCRTFVHLDNFSMGSLETNFNSWTLRSLRSRQASALASRDS